jgi:hypothetical protein
MRRRRQSLRVDTFPFLAVLLSAMGALILLLLVIDRQGKIVARKKAQLAQAEAADQFKKRQAERQAEWERQRQEQRDRLDRQRRELLASVTAARDQVASADREVQEELDRAARLRKQLHDEQARLLQARDAVAARREAARRGAAAAGAAKDDRARLAAELEELERALRALHDRRRDEARKYSLVPYGGRRGGDRKPLYVECTAAGVVFHAERLALEGPDFTPARVRAEVERRLARRQPLEASPYLLMLVRPAGITSYYAAMNALGELKADFGYEFIEADWQLDFPDDDRAPVPPWMAAQGSLPRPPSLPNVTPRAGTAGGDRPPRQGGFFRGAPVAGLAGAAGPNGPAMLGPPAGRNAGPGGAGPPPTAGHAGGPPRGVPAASARSEPGATPLAGAWQPKSTNPPVVGGEGPPKVGRPEPRGPGPLPAPPWLRPDRSGGGQPAGKGDGRPDQKTPAPAGPRADAAPGARPGEAEPSADGPRVPLAGGGGTSVGAGRAELGAGEPAPRPSPLSRLTGNRDWVIVVECDAEGAVLHPQRKRYAVSAEAPRGHEHELARAVREMIARRQATVRPGEPPYRPLLRFRVHPDGLRAYYFAYPLLEWLRVPMSRENVE